MWTLELWRADYRRDGETEIAEALSVKSNTPNVSAVLFRRTVLAGMSQRNLLEELCDFLQRRRLALLRASASARSRRFSSRSAELSPSPMRQVLRFRQLTAATWTQSPPCSKLWSR